MPKRVIAFLSALFLCLCVNSYLLCSVKPGAPFITNYDTEKYNAHGQNWCALQDSRGIIFFGNSAGVLEFDGQKWQFYAMREVTAVRTLAFGSDKTIYFGAVGDFGYLKASDDGKISLISLKTVISEKERDFSDVWQVESCSEGIYFLTRSKFFRLQNGKISVLPGKLAFSQACVLQGTLFYADIDQGICAVQGEQVIPINQLSYLYDGKRITFTPFGEHQLLACKASGDIFVIDFAVFWDKDKKIYQFSRQVKVESLIRPFNVENFSFFKQCLASLYKLHQVDEDSFAMATLRSGIVIFNRSGQIERVINKECGLPGNTILGLQVDRYKNLWAMTEYGVSLIELSVPQSFFGGANGLEGKPMAVTYWKDRLYVSTVQGLFAQKQAGYGAEKSLPQFEFLKNSPIQIWDFLDAGDYLLFVGLGGVYQLQNDEIFKIPDSENITYYCLGRSKRWPDYFFAGKQGGLDVFKNVSGEWNFFGKMSAISSNIRHICEDEDGNLWLGTDAQGLILVRFKGESPLEVELQNLGLAAGLPVITGVRAISFQQKIYAICSQGVYRAEFNEDKKKIRFVADSVFGKFFNNPPTRVLNMVSDGKGGAIFSTFRGVFWFTIDKKGIFKLLSGPFEGLPLPDWTIYVAPDETVWIPQKILTRVEPWAKKDYQQSFPALIRQVKVRGEKTIFSGTYAVACGKFKSDKTVFISYPYATQIVELPYRHNALTFEFSASFFEKPQTTKFQYFLEGFDEQWSEWKSINYCEYTNLPEGVYRFRVRAKNLYGTISQEAIFSIRILPPWYRTWWAICIWICAAALIVTGIVQIYTWRLKKQKIYLQKLVAERTRQLQEASLTDPLTGLRNRRFISEVLQDDIAAFVGLKKYQLKMKEQRKTTLEESVFGIFLFDIDYFKKVNDTYGHDAGDQILKQFAAILKSSVRKDDALMRIGGEEFLVVLKKTKPDYLDVFVTKILQMVAQTEFDIGRGRKIQKTCSVGYISFPFYPQFPDLLSFEQCVMIADLGLYYAKENGRNQGVHIKPGGKIPAGEEIIQKALTTLNYAIEEDYLKIEKIIKG